MMQQFKQEYPEIKKESDANSEKDFEEINRGFRIINPNKVKQEKPETTENQQSEADKSSLVPVPMDIEEKEPSVIEEVNTVNLINESGDESTSTSSKRKSDDSNDDVIELSDNSVLEAPRRLSLVPALKRRKLLERPICTPKKSPPNSYKSLIKQNSNFSLSSYGTSSTSLVPTTAKSKLISTSSALNKSTIRRKSLNFKSKGAFKTIRFAAAKAKRRALNKKLLKKQQQQQQSTVDASHASEKSQLTNDENAEPLDEEEEEEDNSSTEKSSEDSVTNDVTSEEQNEEKSMDGSSECSGKSNIDLTIDRVAKGYFSESEVFSSLNKHRKTKGQKKFEAKLLVLCEKKKKIKKKIENELKEKEKLSQKSTQKKVVVAGKKKVIRVVVNKSKDTRKKKKKVKKVKKKIVETVKEVLDESIVIKKAGKSTKKSKAKEPTIDVEVPTLTEEKPKKQAKKLKIEEVPSTHSTPKRKAPVKKAPKKIEIETDDDMTIETSVTKDEDTSNNLLSSAPTTTTTTVTQNVVEEIETTPVDATPPPTTTAAASVTKPLLDETDVANNNDEYFEDNNHNRYKPQEPLTLYKTPGYGWTTALNKTSNKRGKRGAKYTKTKKMRVTIPSDIMIPKSTSIPRWSNGWMWEGSPYQALVFLNVS